MRRDGNKGLNWVACCVFAATLVACGGGSIGVDDPTSGIPTNTGGTTGFDNTATQGTSGAPLTVTQKGTRITFSSDTGTVVMWAILREADKVIIGWSGNRYIYEHSAAPPTTLQPEGTSGTLVVGGQVAGGAEIGLPTHQIAGRIEPHVLIINGLSVSDDTEVEYVFSACDQTLCEGGPVSTTSKTVATNAPEDLDGALRATFAKDGSAGQIMFTVARTDVATSSATSGTGSTTSGTAGTGYDYYPETTTTTTSSTSGNGSLDSGTQTGGNQDSGGTTPAAVVPPKADSGGGSDNDWIWWVVGGAAVIGAGYLIWDNWDSDAGGPDCPESERVYDRYSTDTWFCEKDITPDSTADDYKLVESSICSSGWQREYSGSRADECASAADNV